MKRDPLFAVDGLTVDDIAAGMPGFRTARGRPSSLHMSTLLAPDGRMLRRPITVMGLVHALDGAWHLGFSSSVSPSSKCSAPRVLQITARDEETGELLSFTHRTAPGNCVFLISNAAPADLRWRLKLGKHDDDRWHDDPCSQTGPFD